MRARIGALALHAQHDSTALTEAARANSPAQLAYFERQVDPDGLLDEAERQRRAEYARSEHFARLAYKSARARAKKRRV
jgi:hypothetical protein